MKITKTIIAVALANLMICFGVSAQTKDTVNVSATVAAGGTSSLSIESLGNDPLIFVTDSDLNSDGSLQGGVTGGSLLVGSGDGTSASRFVSTFVELSYTVEALAAGGSWSIKIYTTNTTGKIGLYNSTEDSTILLKFNQADVDGDFSPISPDENWSGDAATYSFVTNVVDDGSTGSDDFVNASTIIKSDSVDAIGFNPSLKIRFGTDVAGAIAGSYSSTVVFNLFVE